MAAILFEFLESINNIQLPVWKRSVRQVPRLVLELDILLGSSLEPARPRLEVYSDLVLDSRDPSHNSQRILNLGLFSLSLLLG